MAARPGTRRGREEWSDDGSPARPSTRGKSYLEEPTKDSLQRPTSRRGPHDAAAVFSRTSAPPQQRQGQLVQPQRQKGSSWQHIQQQAAARGSRGGHLQEDPSDVSVSVSDLDAMGSTLSIGADSINKKSGSASASRTAALQPMLRTVAGNPVSSSSQRTVQLQGPVLEVLRLDSPKQQTPARSAGAGHTATTVAATVPVVEPSQAYTRSDSPAYSDDFLSIEGSGVIIEYSEPSVAAPTHHTQQHRQSLGPGYVGSSDPTLTADAANTPVQQPPRQLPAAAAARSQPYSELSTDDSVISVDIEFSNSSATAGIDSSPAAAASPAVTAASAYAQTTRPVEPLPMRMPSVAQPAAAAAAPASRLTTATAAGRRVAGSNLQLADEDSVSSYGSAEIEFEPSVGAVSTGLALLTRTSLAGTVLVGQHAAAAEQKRSPAQSRAAAAATGLSAGSAATAVDEAAAAAATEELFAMLLAVPKRQDDSSSSSSGSTKDQSVDRYSPPNDSAGPASPAGDSPKGGLSKGDLSSRSSSRTHSSVPQHIAASAAASDDAQQLPSAALDVLSGLQELHGTLQVVRQMSLSSSDASSTTDDSSEQSADSLVEQSSSYHIRNRMRQQSTKLLASPDSRISPTRPQSHKADAAAAETNVPVAGSSTAVKHQGLLQYSAAVKEQQGSSPSAAAAEVRANGIIQQQGHTTYSHSSSVMAVQQAVGAAESTGINSQTISVDIDDLLRQQTVAAAAVGTTKQARTAPVTAASAAKHRSVALQVGGSNEKSTQVMFDEPRQLLWDGGSLIQQQQQQQRSIRRQPAAPSRGLATTLTPPATGTGAIGSAAGSWSVAAVPTSSSFGLGRLGGLSTGSCWSVLSAALQQFRAAALLDQLEGLLRTAAAAGQQASAAVQGPESGQPSLQQQQQQVAVSGRSVSAAEVAAPLKTPEAAEWSSIPAVIPQTQQQQQKKNSQQGNSRHQAHGNHIANDTAGAWMTLPLFEAGAASASAQESGPVALDTTADADGGEQLYTAAQQPPPPAAAVLLSPPAAADSGWFTLPLASAQKPFLPPPASPSNRAPKLHSVMDLSSTSDQKAATLAEVHHDAGWRSLPIPANLTSGATAVSPKAAQTPEAAAEGAGWFSLPGPATAVAAPAAAAPTAPGDNTGWFSLPGPAAAVVASRPPAAPPAAAAPATAVPEDNTGWLSLPGPAAAVVAPRPLPGPLPPPSAEACDAGWLNLPIATEALTASAPPAAVVALGAAPTAAPANARLKSLLAAPAAAAAVVLQECDESLRADTDSGWMALPFNTVGTTAALPAAAADRPSNISVSAGPADTAPYGIAAEHSSSSVSSVSTISDLSPTGRSSPSHQHTAAEPATSAARIGASGVGVLSNRQETTGLGTISSSLGVSDVLQQSKDAAALAAAAVMAHQQYTSDFEDVSDSIDCPGNRVEGTAKSTAGGGEGGADTAARSEQYTSDFEAVSNLPELNDADQMIHAAAIAPITPPAAAAAKVAAAEQTTAGVGRVGGQVLPTTATGAVDLDQNTAIGAAAEPAGPEVTPATAAATTRAAAQCPAAAAVGNSSKAPLDPTTQEADIDLQDQYQQQQGVTGVDTMLRYLTYLDSLVTQGLAPPGLTLATAKTLRDTLLQTISTSQQQQWQGGVNAYAYGLPSSQDLRALAATTAAAGAGDLYYEDLVATCCLDSFMSSSLLQLKRKLARPVVRTAWGADTGQLSGGLGATHGKQAAALSVRSAAENTGEQTEAGRCATQAYWAVPGRQCMFSGHLEVSSRPNYRYTTLEDTIKLIKQHRVSVYGSCGVIGELR